MFAPWTTTIVFYAIVAMANLSKFQTFCMGDIIKYASRNIRYNNGFIYLGIGCIFAYFRIFPWTCIYLCQKSSTFFMHILNVFSRKLQIKKRQNNVNSMSLIVNKKHCFFLHLNRSNLLAFNQWHRYDIFCTKYTYRWWE